ncbi:MAG: hypothetical protein E5X92_28585, partial [Mesorhizobium sp.]
PSTDAVRGADAEGHGGTCRRLSNALNRHQDASNQPSKNLTGVVHFNVTHCFVLNKCLSFLVLFLYTAVAASEPIGIRVICPPRYGGITPIERGRYHG